MNQSLFNLMYFFMVVIATIGALSIPTDQIEYAIIRLVGCFVVALGLLLRNRIIDLLAPNCPRELGHLLVIVPATLFLTIVFGLTFLLEIRSQVHELRNSTSAVDFECESKTPFVQHFPGVAL